MWEIHIIIIFYDRVSRVEFRTALFNVCRLVGIRQTAAPPALCSAGVKLRVGSELAAGSAPLLSFPQ